MFLPHFLSRRNRNCFDLQNTRGSWNIMRLSLAWTGNGKFVLNYSQSCIAKSVPINRYFVWPFARHFIRRFFFNYARFDSPLNLSRANNGSLCFTSFAWLQSASRLQNQLISATDSAFKNNKTLISIDWSGRKQTSCSLRLLMKMSRESKVIFQLKNLPGWNWIIFWFT